MKRFLAYSLAFAFFSVPALADIIDDIEDIENLEGGQRPPEKKQVPSQIVPQPTPSKKTPTGSSGETSKKKSKPTKDRKSASRAPIKLKSDGRSTYTKDGGVIYLRKNVVITQEELRLQADEAEVHVDVKKKDDRVKRVEISGSVKVSKFSDDPTERIVAHGDRAIFSNRKQNVRLMGNARLFKGGHLIKGKEIVYDIQTGLITVDQAQGVVQPEEK